MGCVYLSGSEDVYRAASMMQSAAQDMIRASSDIEGSVQRLEQILDNFIIRLEQALSGLKVPE
jgi:hypothetical protein